MSDDDTHHSRKRTRRFRRPSSVWISTSDTATSNANFGTGSINIGGSQTIFYDEQERPPASGLNTRPRGTTRTVSDSPRQPVPQEHNERGIAEETKGPPHTAHHPQEAGLGVPGSQRTGLNKDSTHADILHPISPSGAIKPIVSDDQDDVSSDNTLDNDEAEPASVESDESDESDESKLINLALTYFKEKKTDFETTEGLEVNPWVISDERRYKRIEGDVELAVEHHRYDKVSLRVKKRIRHDETGDHQTSPHRDEQTTRRARTSSRSVPASESRNANFQGQGIQNISSGRVSIGGDARVDGEIHLYDTGSGIRTNDPTARALAQQITNTLPGGFMTSLTPSDFHLPGDLTINDDGPNGVRNLGDGTFVHGNVQSSSHFPRDGETSASRRRRDR